MKKYFVVSIAVLTCLFLLLSCASPPLDIRAFTEKLTNTSSLEPNLDVDSLKQYIVNNSNDYNFVIDDLKDFQIDESEPLGEIPDLFESDENAYKYQYYQVICSFNIERPLGTFNIGKKFLYAKTGNEWKIYTTETNSIKMIECNISGTWTGYVTPQSGQEFGDLNITIEENPQIPDGNVQIDFPVTIICPIYEWNSEVKMVTISDTATLSLEEATALSGNFKGLKMVTDEFDMYGYFDLDNNSFSGAFDTFNKFTLTRRGEE